MPLLVAIKNRVYVPFIFLTFSILISAIIAVAVPLQKDEIGAIINIYLPAFTGIITLLVYSAIAIFNKKNTTRWIILITLMCVNIITGIALKINFNRLNDRLQSELHAGDTAADIYTNASRLKDQVIVQNMDSFPAYNRAVFSYSYDPEPSLKRMGRQNTIIDHNISAIRIKNQRNKIIIITGATFSDDDLWAITLHDNQNNKHLFPMTIAPGDSVELNIVFTANALNRRVESLLWKAALKFQHSAIGLGRFFNYQLPHGSTCSIVSGRLYFETNDKKTAIRAVNLAGIWEYRQENDWEPGLQMILNSLNFKTKVGFTYFDNGLKGEKTTNQSDEIAADYFEVANAGRPMRIRKIASYHGCCTTEDTDTLALYDLNARLTRQLQYTNKYSGQMLLPNASILPGAEHLSKLVGPFAVKIGESYTDRTRNHGKKIGIRVWKAVDQDGKIISNAYILGSDYLGKKGTNYDYQDNVYYIENIKLYNKSAAPLMAKK